MSNNFGKRSFNQSTSGGSPDGICNWNADTWCKRLSAANCRCSEPWEVKGKGSSYNSHIGSAHMQYIGPGWS